MRESGILLPISSLPSDFGIGCFSKEAYTFVDQLLAAAGQKYWQICPLAPQATAILLISPFPPMRAIRISLTWRS